MYLEAKETAQLYKLLTEKLGNDTTEAMFKYIDNKTERSVEATIKTLATKNDIANVKDEIANLRIEMGSGLSDLRKEVGIDFSNFRKEMGSEFSNFRKEMGEAIIKLHREIAEGHVKLHKEMAENKTENTKWMFIFWIGQVGATLAILMLFLKK
jgi:hypothetical protein